MTPAEPAGTLSGQQPSRPELLRQHLRSGCRRAGLHRGGRLGPGLAAAIVTHPDDRLTFWTDTAAEIPLGDLLTSAMHLAGACWAR